MAPCTSSLLLLPLLAMTVAAAPGRRCEPTSVEADGFYSNRYDNVDVDAILNSGRLLKAYVECLMDRGACTREGCFLKAVVPDALNNECSKCNQKQKQLAGKVLSFMLQNHRGDYWNEILGKYDPTGEFRKRHEWLDEDEEDPEDRK